MRNFEKFGWYIHRLFSMSPVEVGYRIRQRIRIETDRGRFPIPSLPPSSTIIPVNGRRRFRQEQDTPFFFSWQERDKYIQHFNVCFPQEQQATLQAAQDLCEDRFELFGQIFHLPDPPPWQRDPVTGRGWPEQFWADIDTRDGKTIGGVKWVWELNRHYHLVTLGKAYFFTGEERYAVEVCAQLASWVEANPPGVGVNWTSSLEMALRIINWSWTLAFIQPSSALTQSLLSSIMQSIEAQAQHIARYLSAYSSANNHLIGEAAGLAVAGICFPNLPQSEKWREIGLDILECEIEKQILLDGVPAEQAPDYLCFILDFNLLVWRLVELTDVDKVPSVWYQRLEAACNFIMHLMDDAGNVPAIGDGDDAWVVRLDDRPEANNFRSLLASAAAILQRPDFKAAAGEWDEKSHWLLGEEGRQRFEELPDLELSLPSTSFPDGGYCVMRSPGRRIVFDYGPLGYLSTAAHGHADALSLIVSVGGTSILIDPGTYAYQEGGGMAGILPGYLSA